MNDHLCIFGNNFLALLLIYFVSLCPGRDSVKNCIRFPLESVSFLTPFRRFFDSLLLFLGSFLLFVGSPEGASKDRNKHRKSAHKTNKNRLKMTIKSSRKSAKKTIKTSRILYGNPTKRGFQALRSREKTTKNRRKNDEKSTKIRSKIDKKSVKKSMKNRYNIPKNSDLKIGRNATRRTCT